MFRELRDFLFRGNIVELAVAVVVAGAFGALVTSLVADIITPVISLLGVPDFSTWVITVSGLGGSTATFAIGNFINTLIAFVVVAVSIFFLVVKPMNALAARRAAGAPADEPAAPTELDLLTEIRDELRRRGA